MFLIALFTIVKIQKQPKGPLRDEWIKNIWGTHTHTHTHIYNEILLNHKKKKWDSAIYKIMDGSRVY